MGGSCSLSKSIPPSRSAQRGASSDHRPDGLDLIRGMALLEQGWEHGNQRLLYDGQGTLAVKGDMHPSSLQAHSSELYLDVESNRSE